MLKMQLVGFRVRLRIYGRKQKKRELMPLITLWDGLVLKTQKPQRVENLQTHHLQVLERVMIE